MIYLNSRAVKDYIKLHELDKYYLFFSWEDEERFKEKMDVLFDLSKKYLDRCSNEKLKEQCFLFYKLIVKFPIHTCRQHYYNRLLKYFHSKHLIEYKTDLIVPFYRTKKKYMACFFYNDRLDFVKSFSSLREIRLHTGQSLNTLKIKKIGI